MNGASLTSRRRRASSTTFGSEDESRARIATSADPASVSPTPRTDSEGALSSVAATLVAAGPLSRTPSCVVGLVARLATGALREVAGDFPGGLVGRQGTAEEGLQRLERDRAVLRVRGWPQREEPEAVLHRPAHRLRLAIGHDERDLRVLVTAEIGLLALVGSLEHEQVAEDDARGRAGDPSDGVWNGRDHVDVVARGERAGE